MNAMAPVNFLFLAQRMPYRNTAEAISGGFSDTRLISDHSDSSNPE